MDVTGIFLKIVSMSLTASYCVIFICILRIPLRRAPKIFSYLLWGIVALRLLCPVALDSRFSLLGEGTYFLTRLLETEFDLRGQWGSGRGPSFMPEEVLRDSVKDFNSQGGSPSGEDVLIGEGTHTGEGILSGEGILTREGTHTGESILSGEGNFYGDGVLTREGTHTGESILSGEGTFYGDGIHTGEGTFTREGTHTGESILSGEKLSSEERLSFEKEYAKKTFGLEGNRLSGDGSFLGENTRPGMDNDSVEGICGDTLGRDYAGTAQGSRRGRPDESVLLHLAAYGWLMGVLGLLTYYVTSYLRLYRRLIHRASRVGSYRQIPVLEAGGLETPFVLGIINPSVYLPQGMEEWEVRQCLAHEYTHIRRKDYLVKQFAFLLLCVYWFQPLLWLAFHLMSKDMEMSCDESALRGANLEERKAYSNALLRLSSSGRQPFASPLAFGEHSISSRIKNILRFRKPAVGSFTLCSLLLVISAGGLLTNPKREPSNYEDPDYFAMDDGVLYDPPIRNGEETEESVQNLSVQTVVSLNWRELENPYDAEIPDMYRGLQEMLENGSHQDQARELRMDIKGKMISYWSELVKAKGALDNQINDRQKQNLPESENQNLILELYALRTSVYEAKVRMGQVDKTVDMISGLAKEVKPEEYTVDYPLQGVLQGESVPVRTMPADSAPQADVLSEGDLVSIVGFGRYLLYEDDDFRDYFTTNDRVLQDCHKYAAVLYRSGEENDTTVRKGYVSLDALDISGNTQEAFLYWIGRAWSQAYCAGDREALYRMAADKEAFADWEREFAFPGRQNGGEELSIPQRGSPFSVCLIFDRTPESREQSSYGDVALQYFVEGVQESEPNIWVQRQDLEIVRMPDGLSKISRIEELMTDRVFFNEIRDYREITGYSDFQDAYLTAYEPSPSFFDFEGSGYGMLYCMTEQNNIDIDSTKRFFSMEKAFENYLNLSGGTMYSFIMSSAYNPYNDNDYREMVPYVEYTFAEADENGNNKIAVAMHAADGYYGRWCLGYSKTNNYFELLGDFLSQNLELELRSQ